MRSRKRKGNVFGLPCIIGRQGIERKLLLPRNAEEQRLLEESAAKLNQACDSLFVSTPDKG